MTTFKEAPRYAEYVLHSLDMANKLSSTGLFPQGPTIEDVLRTVMWKFKGGDMEEVTKHSPVVSSNDYFVNTTSAGLASELELCRKFNQAESKDLRSIRRILSLRKHAIPLSTNAMRSRLAVYVAASYYTGEEAEPQSVMTGLAAVYRVFTEVWLNARKPNVRSASWTKGGEMWTFVREAMIGSSAASMLDVPSAMDNTYKMCNALVEMPLDLLMKTHRVLMHAYRFSKSRAVRVAAQKAGSELIESKGTPADYVTCADATLKMPNDELNDLIGGKTRVTYGAMITRLGSKVLVLSDSDMTRLIGMVMSTASMLVAAVAQANTGNAHERDAGATMTRRMIERVDQMTMMFPKVALGDEVLVCKGLKRAFSLFLGHLSGPLCVPELPALRRDAIECISEEDCDTWVSACRGLPINLAFNVGKMYKILPAPDSSPGGTLIDRLKTTVAPNPTDEKALDELRDELTDQIVYARAITPNLPRLRVKPGVARPSWYVSYLSGDMTYVRQSGIRDILAWEKSTDMPKRDPLDPAVWKDSGLSPDTLEKGLDVDTPKWLKNLLLRMVFDPDCPMPGDEEMSSVEEWLSKSDSKPESHKDPYRSIFSASIKVRFKKSLMEKAVHQVAEHHPGYMIGVETSAKEARLRAATSSPAVSGSTAFFYSFDIKGWSPLMPEAPQRISHEIWAKMYRTTLFDQSSLAMQGATVYINNAGYQGWYINTEANFEGYDGKEMTMINVAMLANSVKRFRRDPRLIALGLTKEQVDKIAALLLAYIDDGMARIELQLEEELAARVFRVFIDCCVTTFQLCGYKIETSKCFPSDTFFIFLNESYLAGRHLVHGVRAASQMCASPPEPHESILEHVDRITATARGAVMAGLDAQAAFFLQMFHVAEVIKDWVGKVDPVIGAAWCMGARAWGCLGMPTILQLGAAVSGDSMTESIVLFQLWSQASDPIKAFFLNVMRSPLNVRSKVSILNSPFTATVRTGHLRTTRLVDAVRLAMMKWKERNMLGTLPTTFLAYGDWKAYEDYAELVVPGEPGDTVQAQLLADLRDAHPQSIFRKFCSRIERGATVRTLVGASVMNRILKENREDARISYRACRARFVKVVS